MKKLNVIVKDKNTLILKEAGNVDDYIDLSDLSSIDTTALVNLIESGKDKIYQAKLEDFKKTIELQCQNELINTKAEYNKEILELQNEIKRINEGKKAEFELKKQEFETAKQIIIAEKETKYTALYNESQNQIQALKTKIQSILDSQATTLENEKLKLNEVHFKEVQALNSSITKIQQEASLKLKNQELIFTKQFDEMKLTLETKLQEKENQYLALQRQKAALNVKQTGEDLESWCHNEMLSYMQNGFSNCTWTKDNKVIKDEYEDKGSKADYIFKIFASDEHNPEDLLASVCLDMKDENPNSVNKKTNADYFKQLDKNRIKKECKYALLVSNLEMDKPNDSPIYKVIDYPDMYVVRPAYMMTFLNLITSLTIRFKKLVLEVNKEKLELKNSIVLKDEFDKLKGAYLDKPLEQMANHLQTIKAQGEALRKISSKIEDECNFIIKNYIDSITAKLAKFEIEIAKNYKKYAKANSEKRTEDVIE